MQVERALGISRAAATVSTATVLGFAAISEWVHGAPRAESLALPAGLIGIVSPVIGRHLYELLRQRAGHGSPGERTASFVNANLAALGVTTATALFGIVVYALSGRIVALTGVLMQVILAGAIWPTPERLENFLE